MPNPQELLAELKKVKFPGFSRDIVSFGMVKDIHIGSHGVTVELTTSSAQEDKLDEIRRQVTQVISAASGLPVRVEMEQAHPPSSGAAPQPKTGVPGVRHIIAVASGKGGVGKSTVAVNLACALVTLGHRVGLLDADVYGPSVPMMLGIAAKPTVRDDRRIVPVETLGLKAISMGMFLGERTPVIWRGPMVTKLITEFLRKVEWGELDYLVLDLPPGTGDAQLTIAQQVPLSGGVIVTTPQDVALADVARGVKMFQQMDAPVLGVIENMSLHVCPSCGHESAPFGHGGARTLAREMGLAILGELPLERHVREAGDVGTPIVAAEPSHPVSRAFGEIAERILVRLRESQATDDRPAAS